MHIPKLDDTFSNLKDFRPIRASTIKKNLYVTSSNRYNYTHINMHIIFFKKLKYIILNEPHSFSNTMPFKKKSFSNTLSAKNELEKKVSKIHQRGKIATKKKMKRRQSNPRYKMISKQERGLSNHK